MTTSVSNATEATPPSGPTGFAALNLTEPVLRAIDEVGYTEPTPVQAATYPIAITGRDIIVQARTGTGKTAAFGIPLVDKLVTGDPWVQALVLAPTRELAVQSQRELSRLAQYKGLHAVAIYGGAPMGRQIDELKSGAQLVSGTPGRVLDHLRRGTFDPSRLKVLVLDEMDEMLSMGFAKELNAILELIPPKGRRQTMCFSATVDGEIRRHAERHMHEPEMISLSSDAVSAAQITHQVYMITGRDRISDLVRVLEVEDPDSAIVFCNMRSETERVAQGLKQAGFNADWLNGDLPQKDRERIMSSTREGKLRYLVATDVAARGIDISHLTHVINFTFPESAAVYIHRTGRTGRAGRTGCAISLVGPEELGRLYYLRLEFKISPVERSLPTHGELKTRQEIDRIGLLEAAFADRPNPNDISVARRLLTHPENERILAGLLHTFFGTKDDVDDEAAAARRSKPGPDLETPARAARERERFSGPGRDRGRERDDRPRPRERERDGDRSRDRSRDSARPPRDREASGELRDRDSAGELRAGEAGSESLERDSAREPHGRDGSRESRSRGSEAGSEPRDRNRDPRREPRERDREARDRNRGGEARERAGDTGETRGGNAIEGGERGHEPSSDVNRGGDGGGESRSRNRGSEARDRGGETRQRVRSGEAREQTGEAGEARERSRGGASEARDRNRGSEDNAREGSRSGDAGEGRERNRGSEPREAGGEARERTRNRDSGREPREREARARGGEARDSDTLGETSEAGRKLLDGERGAEAGDREPGETAASSEAAGESRDRNRERGRQRSERGRGERSAARTTESARDTSSAEAESAQSGEASEGSAQARDREGRSRDRGRGRDRAREGRDERGRRSNAQTELNTGAENAEGQNSSPEAQTTRGDDSAASGGSQARERGKARAPRDLDGELFSSDRESPADDSVTAEPREDGSSSSGRRRRNRSRGRERTGDESQPTAASESNAASGTSDEAARSGERPQRSRQRSNSAEATPRVAVDGELLAPDGNGADDESEHEPTEPLEGLLYLNVGKRDGLRVPEVTRLLRDSCELARGQIGRIRVRDRYTFVDVPEGRLDSIITTLSGQVVHDKPLAPERAKTAKS